MKPSIFMKMASLAACLIFALNASAQTVEKKIEAEEGLLKITSAEKLFSDCKIRMCSFTPNEKGAKTLYGIELDLTDRVQSASKGDLLIISFEDGSTIELANLYDTQAEVSQETRMETQHNMGTAYVPAHRAWGRVIGAHPLTYTYEEDVPVTTTTTFASLYYKVTEEQIDKIIKGDIKGIKIVNNRETIEKKARPFSEAVADLFPVIK